MLMKLTPGDLLLLSPFKNPGIEVFCCKLLKLIKFS